MRRPATAVLFAAALAVAGCSSGESPSPASTTASIPSGEAPEVTSPAEPTAGWEGFCAAMAQFHFDHEPSGAGLDELEAVVARVAAAAPEELREDAALFEATFEAAITAARDDGGALTPEVLYDVLGPEPAAAVQAVFGATLQHCPDPSGGSERGSS